MKLKIGLDIHGVIDSEPELYAHISMALVAAGHEIHIITGPSRSQAEEELERLGFLERVHYTHLCSIIDYRAAQGVTVTYDDKRHGWLRPELWDTAKAEYCEEEGIHLHIDDSEAYGKHFKGTAYLRKERKGAADKAVTLSKDELCVVLKTTCEKIDETDEKDPRALWEKKHLESATNKLEKAYHN